MEKRAKLAIIGGSGFEQFFSPVKQISVNTPYGVVSPLSACVIGGRDVIFLSRHGVNHLIPPHKVNYRANIWALHKLNVDRIIALNAVGAINPNFKPCDVVVPHDFIDFTKARNTPFYDDAPVTHIDMSTPFCPEIRAVVLEKLCCSGLSAWGKAVLLCTEGPRFETPAEIEIFKRLGADLVGMTSIPEAVLTRELEICYAPICFVSNMAAGLQQLISPLDTIDRAQLITPQIGQALIDAVLALPLVRKCHCSYVLTDARFP